MPASIQMTTTTQLPQLAQWWWVMYPASLSTKTVGHYSLTPSSEAKPVSPRLAVSILLYYYLNASGGFSLVVTNTVLFTTGCDVYRLDRVSGETR